MLYCAYHLPPPTGCKWFCYFLGGGNVSDDSPAARALIDLKSAQLGDTSLGDVAANIYHGADADSLVDLLRYQIDKESQFRMLDVEVREIRQTQVDQKHDELVAELRMQRWILISGLILVILVLFLAL